MKVLDLRCAQGHGFEGWFASLEDFESQCARDLVECPMCGDRTVSRLPSAPRLNIGGSGRAGGPDPEEQQLPVGSDTAQVRWMQAVRKLLAETEDVGNRFADEARRMHYGEAPERGIRGEATTAETQALREEGVPVFSLPLPAALKKPLH